MESSNLGNELSKLRIDRSRKRPRPRWGRWALVLLVLAAGAVGATDHQHANSAVKVRVVRLEPETPETAAAGSAVLTAGGYIIPRHKVEISSKIIGRVKDLLVDRGDKVNKGEVLLRIEDEEYVAQVRVAEARLATARARLAEMRAGSRQAEIEAARAAVKSAEATLAQSESDLKRVEELDREHVIAKQALDRARTERDVAEANLRSAKKNLELVETWPRKEQLDAAIAEEGEAEANLAYSKTLLDFTVVTAPISGTILEKVAEKGELVTNANYGGTRGAKSSVVSMANLDDLQVEIDLNENDLAKVRMAQKCEIRLDAYPDVTIKGEVDEIAPQADRQKATVQVKVRVIDPPHFVRPEVNARVTFLEESKTAVNPATPAAPRVWIPRSALVDRATGAMVYIASDGTAVARNIKTGAEGPRGVEVAEGLAGTELLIVEPPDNLRDGAKIQIES